MWQGIENNGDEYAVVHVEPANGRRFKRDLNYHLLTDDLNNWISGNYKTSSNFPHSIIVPLDNYGIMRTAHQQPVGNVNYQTTHGKLDTSDSNLFQSYLSPTYDSFWTILQSPFKTIAQLTNWNGQSTAGNWNQLIPVLSNTNFNPNAISTANFINRKPELPSPTSSINSIQNPVHGDEYKSSASSNAVRHTAAQEEAPVYLSAFVPNFRLDIYHNLDEIYDYLERVASLHKHIRIYTIGFSHENRPIKAIEIHQDIPNLNRKMVYLDGLIHAREHITTASLLNIIEQILIRKIECNFLIVPVINVSILIEYIETFVKNFFL